MSYIETARRIKIKIRNRDKSTVNTSVSLISNQDKLNSSSLYEKNEINEINPIYLEEATRLYRQRGWIQIWSEYLNESIYLVRSQSIRVPNSAFQKYTDSEAQKLNGLNSDEKKALHQAKIIFKGTIVEEQENNYGNR